MLSCYITFIYSEQPFGVVTAGLNNSVNDPKGG